MKDMRIHVQEKQSKQDLPNLRKDERKLRRKGDNVKSSIKQGKDSDSHGVKKQSNRGIKRVVSRKKKIPKWATLDKKSSLALKHSQSSIEIVADAIKASADLKGHASIYAMKQYLSMRCPDWPKVTLKSSISRAIAQNRITQVKGQGLSGSFKLNRSRNHKSLRTMRTESLDDVLPNVFTWVTEPKAASSQQIKKYIALHHPALDVTGTAFKNALMMGVKKGQLVQISGKASSGSFQLVDGAKKTGTKFEDAIEDAIIAMTEPKEASVPALRNYFSQYHLEFHVNKRPDLLKRALQRCEDRGWIKRLSGKGFSGTFRLAFPYHPCPRELWGDWYEEAETEVMKGYSKKKTI